ncbi:MAG: hypothetical protein Pg6A_13110 [Termitinemataceae bacterium]|nr:MAG: hypothetical protein Pg6A_13110 [Termitinemataceae bacterium]
MRFTMAEKKKITAEYAPRYRMASKINLVQHDGGNPSGEFCYTLTMTDVKTGWTVHFALMNKAACWVEKGLEDMFHIELDNLFRGFGIEVIWLSFSLMGFYSGFRVFLVPFYIMPEP